jgi:hypothetical protein
MRILRITSLVCLAAALCAVAVFVPVFLAVSLALRWNDQNAGNRAAPEQTRPPSAAVSASEECPPVHAAKQEGRLPALSTEPVIMKLETLQDGRTEFPVLAQCGEWIRIQQTPEQWLHPASRATVTLGAKGLSLQGAAR